MLSIDLSRARLTPFMHQLIGVEALVKLYDPNVGRIWPGCFMLADEMGAGKTKQTIDAAHILYTQKVIDRVLVVAPASVRGVWFDPELGELAKHLWSGIPSRIREFHSRVREWWWEANGSEPFEWMITNYEFIRSKNRLLQLRPFCTPKTLLVLDESSAVKNHRAEQTKAVLILRKDCGRVVLLNGTPIANNPLDMFSQGQIMDPRILGCRTYFHFRARYAIMGGWENKQIVGWQNLGDLQKRFKPYVLRRLKKDCLDLPEAMPPVTFTVTLTDETWKIYKSMRDEMVAWLSSNEVAISQQAGVKALRLAQITSGFIGGIEDGGLENDPVDPDLLSQIDLPKVDYNHHMESTTDELTDEDVPIKAPIAMKAIGREKLEFILGWYQERLEDDPKLKLLVWCRFRPELFRMMKEADEMFRGKVELGMIYGGQKRVDREASLRLLDPRTAPEGPVLFGGTYGTGSLGINLTAAHTAVNLSSDFSLYKYQQSAARVDRPGQKHPVTYIDVIAEGPKGQKTIDHTIVKVRRNKEDISTWTTSAWVKALTEE